MCLVGEISTLGSSSCWVDYDYYSAACSGLGCLIAQFIALVLLLTRARLTHQIVDVTQCNGRTLVTTLEPHGVVGRSGRSVRVHVSGTGHTHLDGWFRVRRLDAIRLELQSSEGQGISDGVVTSMGVLRHPVLREFIDAKPLVLAMSLTLLPVPWFLHFFGPLWSDTRSQVERDWNVKVRLLATFMGTVLAVIAAAIVRTSRANLMTPLESRLAAFRQHLRTQNPNPTSCDRGPSRAVRIEQVIELYQFFHDMIQMRSAYYLNENIIKPLTSHVQLSYAELAGPSTLQFFVSHYWGTPFTHFVHTLQQHAMTVGAIDWSNSSYWICFLSNNQWKVADEMGGDDAKNSSFYQALCSPTCLATCMVLDSKALPLSRSWCLLEVLQTYRLKKENSDNTVFQGLLFCTTDGVIGRATDGCLDVSVALAKRLVDLSVKDACATKPEDHASIMKLVEAEGGSQCIDTFIRKSLMGTLTQVQTRFANDMQLLIGKLGSSTLEALAGPQAVLPTLLSSRVAGSTSKALQEMDPGATLETAEDVAQP